MGAVGLLRETRRFKTKGFVISFGDLMLPLVGLVAIGLLFVAGKIFFLYDLQAESQPIPVTVAPPVMPRVADESVSEPSAETGPVMPEPSRQRVSAGGNLVLDLVRNNNAQDNAAADTNDSTEPNDAPQSADGVNREEIIIVSTPALATPVQAEPQSMPQPQPQEQPQAQPSLRPTETGSDVAEPAQPEPAQPPRQTQPERTDTQPNRANWMVQVGAYSTRAAADAVLERLTQDGHTVTVNSSRTLHRVMVQAGPTRQDALNLASRLGQAGFPGAFIVPPRS